MQRAKGFSCSLVVCGLCLRFPSQFRSHFLVVCKFAKNQSRVKLAEIELHRRASGLPRKWRWVRFWWTISENYRYIACSSQTVGSEVSVFRVLTANPKILVKKAKERKPVENNYFITEWFFGASFSCFYRIQSYEILKYLSFWLSSKVVEVGAKKSDFPFYFLSQFVRKSTVKLFWFYIKKFSSSW